MNPYLVSQIEDLLRAGMDLIPEGGSEFSGYNAKRQSKYLLWRKNCLDAIATLDDKGGALSARIIGNENGMYFYQSSAELIITVMQDALDAARAEAAASIARMKAEAELREKEAAESQEVSGEKESFELQHHEGENPEQARDEENGRELTENEEEAREAAREQISALEAARALEMAEQARQDEALARARKEAEAAASAQAARSAAAAAPKILIFSLANHVMLKQLQNVFTELSLDHSLITHNNGIWNTFDKLDDGAHYYCVFLLSDRYHGQELMALGYLAGKYPSTTLCCIHAHTLTLGELLPGVSKKEFTVSLDEIKISLVHELKAAGCSISL
jgi:hypothetical protein